jgi:hypothetical protein
VSARAGEGRDGAGVSRCRIDRVETSDQKLAIAVPVKVYNEARDNRKLWYPEFGEIDPRTRKPPE